jgi:serine/threonine protein kinase
MQLSSSNWDDLGEPASPAEAEALAAVRELLPDDAVTHAWSNLTFTDLSGRTGEIDLLLLTRVGFFVVELKGWHGTIAGTQQNWAVTGASGQHTHNERNPWYLTEQKAKRLSSLLKRLARNDHERRAVPFVGALVVLHGRDSRVELKDTAISGLYVLDGYNVKGLPADHNLKQFLNTAPANDAHLIDGPRARQIVNLVKAAGFVATPKNRYVGQYSLEKADPLGEGPTWQDLLATHPAMPDLKRRIRLFDLPPGSSSEAREEAQFAAKRELALTRGIKHDGIVAPLDYVETDSGPALVFDHDDDARPLDEYLADPATTLSFDERLALIRQIGEVLRYAHNRRLTHRGLTPRQVDVTVKGSGPRVAIRDWMTGQRSRSTTGLTLAPLTNISAGTGDVRGLVDQSTWVYLAPEQLRGGDDLPPIPLDVYGLGALAYLILTGAAPAATLAELQKRLASSGGLDPSRVNKDLSEDFARVVLHATREVESERTASVDAFLAGLDKAYDNDTAPGVDHPAAPADPLDATPGQLIGDRFEVLSRRGSGSTGTALEVRDYERAREGDILKLARDDRAGQRLDAEAEVLAKLDHPRVVRLLQGPLDVDGRRALLLSDAGTETLAARISTEGRATLEQLERYGRDLLEAIAYLDSRGVFHRDIKPANLGISPDPGTRKPRLTLFDLSLASEPLENIASGTHGYLDPFLGKARRRQYDRAAELYAVGVTLFEMAAGSLPWWSAGDGSPASPADRVVLTPSSFESSVAGALVEFFGAALAPRVQDRFAGAEQMAAAWLEIFASLDQGGGSGADDAAARDHAADVAVLDTPLVSAGLSARALSGLSRVRAKTVGELLGTPPMQINSIRGLGEQYRKEVQGRIRSWRGRLLTQSEPVGIEPAAGTRAVELIVDGLIPKVTGANEAEVAVLRLLLVAGSTGPFWPTVAEVAEQAGETRAGVAEILDAATKRWGRSAPLKTVVGELVDAIDAEGRVVTLAEAAGAVLLRHGSGVEGANRLRRAAGLVRAAVELDACAQAPQLTPRRPRSAPATGPLEASQVLIALAPATPSKAHEYAGAPPTSDALLDYAHRLGGAADVAVEGGRPTPAATARTGLRSLVDGGVVLTDERLLRLAVAASSRAALSGIGELYPRNLPARDAVEYTLRGAGVRELTEAGVRRRVTARFPTVTDIPAHPELDDLVQRALPGLHWEGGRYTVIDTTGTSAQSAARSLTQLSVSPPSEVARALADSLATRSARTLCVHPQVHDAAARKLAVEFGVQVVDVAAQLVRALRATATDKGAQWDVVLRADSQPASSADATRLRALVHLGFAETWAQILARPEPLLLTYAGPLLRFGLGESLADVFDLGTQRPAARWLLVPRLRSQPVPTLDGHPVPLGADRWLDLPTVLADLTNPNRTTLGVIA